MSEGECRVLLTGLRGVGKSTLRGSLTDRLSMASRSVGDFMQEYCDSKLSSVQREQMSTLLSVEQQMEIGHQLVAEIRSHRRLVLETQSVIVGEFGTFFPAAPIFRKTGMDAVLVLEAPPAEILARRNRDTKRRLARYLEEPENEVGRQQELTKTYAISLAGSLAIPAFIISAAQAPEAVLQTALHAMHMVETEKTFEQGL